LSFNAEKQIWQLPDSQYCAILIDYSAARKDRVEHFRTQSVSFSG
jgi:hypothetical protein